MELNQIYTVSLSLILANLLDISSNNNNNKLIIVIIEIMVNLQFLILISKRIILQKYPNIRNSKLFKYIECLIFIKKLKNFENNIQ